MALLSELADRAQNAVDDASGGVYTQAVIEEWICEAIRDYNNYFRRTLTISQNIATDASTLTVSRLVREVLHVEYPSGNSPPTLLTRKSRYAADFYHAVDNFDFEPVGEYGATEDGGVSPYLIFSSNPTVSDGIVVLTRAIHDAELDSTDLVTVPDEHHHLLVLFVVWKALSERTASQSKYPDTTIRLIQQLKESARIAEADYRRAIALAQETAGSSAMTPAWVMDKHDRIY
ncbi:MAG: hypothetical protein ACK2UY_10795 [Anaerolineae bacterium]